MIETPATCSSGMELVTKELLGISALMADVVP